MSSPTAAEEKAQRDADAMDAAFDKAEASAIAFGKTVGSSIAAAFNSSQLDSAGIDDKIALAAEQASTPIPGVPRFARRLLIQSLHMSIIAELGNHGIVWQAPTSDRRGTHT